LGPRRPAAAPERRVRRGAHARPDPAPLPRPPRWPQLGPLARERVRGAPRGLEAPAMRRARRLLALAASVPVSLGVALTATGWLYLLRPLHVPGPRIG